MLVMRHGRSGERYVFGGENISLKELLAILGIISGRKAILIPVSAGPAQMIAAAVEFLANHVAHRPPTATVEGVRIALWSETLSIEIAP
jgi:dihydroflavonol-4-reductase